MALRQSTVAQKRNYRLQTVRGAKEVAGVWLTGIDLHRAVAFGLPEVDDRYHLWRVPLLDERTGERIGEAVLDAYTSLVDEEKTTAPDLLKARLQGRTNRNGSARRPSPSIAVSPVRNTIACGDAEDVLQDLPAQSVGLAFTSPPYYNARPEYTDYLTYDEYLDKIRRVIRQAHRVLMEGRFFVMNVAPVLIRRASRSEASRRIAVPFDMHRLFAEEGYDFVDDIIWEKPEGAGWATGRGRRFAADRNPLQYKPVPVTEYVLVYRKHTDRLIDWSIRSHPDREAVKASRIGDGYERTNVWRIKPAHDKRHPAVFPLELAERVIRYYSFKGDAVLDPFAGIGTTGKAAAKLGRGYVLIEQNPDYAAAMQREEEEWSGS